MIRPATQWPRSSLATFSPAVCVGGSHRPAGGLEGVRHRIQYRGDPASVPREAPDLGSSGGQGQDEDDQPARDAGSIELDPRRLATLSADPLRHAQRGEVGHLDIEED